MTEQQSPRWTRPAASPSSTTDDYDSDDADRVAPGSPAFRDRVDVLAYALAGATLSTTRAPAARVATKASRRSATHAATRTTRLTASTPRPDVSTPGDTARASTSPDKIKSQPWRSRSE